MTLGKPIAKQGDALRNPVITCRNVFFLKRSVFLVQSDAIAPAGLPTYA